MSKFQIRTVIMVIVIFFTLSCVCAAWGQVRVLNSNDLNHDTNVLRVTGMAGLTLSSSGWLYISEDTPTTNVEALPTDSLWRSLPCAVFRPDTLPTGFWKGSAWFKLSLRVSPQLHHQPLMLVMPSIGAMEIYCNGVFVGGQGRVGINAESEELPSYARTYMRSVPLQCDSSFVYTITVRYSCYQYAKYRRSFASWQPTPLIGMDIALVRREEFQLYESRVKTVLVEFGAYIIAPVLAFLVHLLFFFLYRRERANLALALCNAMIATAAFSGLLLLHNVGQPLSIILAASVITRSAVSFAFLAFAYSLYYLFFDEPYPRSRWFMLLLSLLGQIVALRPLFLDPSSFGASFQGFLVLPLMYSLYIAIIVMLKKPKGSSILGIGIGIVLIATAVETTLELRGIVFAARPSVMGVLIRMGIFLPLPIALMISMGQRIAAQTQALTRQNEMLEHQVQKRTAELQEANEEVHRQLGILEEQSRNIEYANAELQERNTRLDELIQEKADLMNIVAHDLKNPISGIAGMTEMLKEEMPESVVAHELLEQMTQTTGRMLDLVKNLLSAAQIESGKMELRLVTCNVKSLVEYTLRHYQAAAQAKNITFHQEFAIDNALVYGDEQALLQVFDNIISNAVKYSPQGKNVYVRVKQTYWSIAMSHLSGDEWRTNAPMTNDQSTNNHFLRIEVQDEGVGISVEDMKKLFGKYARLSARPTGGEHSTGLGLSIVKTLVSAMRGKVWCESVPNHGATFIIELPMVSA